MASSLVGTSFNVPEYVLPCTSNGKRMPHLGFGTAAFPPVGSETTKLAILEALKLRYRHFDTAAKYGSEQPLGEALAEALSKGLVQSRDELFVTSKLWCGDAYEHRVVPALKRSLQNLKLEYLDLFLIHWPVSTKPGTYEFPTKDEDILPMNFNAVWAAMEECQRLGLTKSIGVSNFSCKNLAQILAFANIPPAVNQVEMSPLWHQKKLREFCHANGILFHAYSPLGAKGTFWGTDKVMENEVLSEIAKAKGKTLAQICLRWAYEQGIFTLVKSYNKERMKQNLEILDWSLSQEELENINAIPQSRCCDPFNTIYDVWDGEF
ncbi:Aldo/keto reductase [Corchorus olitorius]|uniref:Aldo/keto reductase n=1 Tax=Corchorus olitorius TaxID=93759 RepID=A0A1R3I6I4_9ROSI|nr:Aldo/keto reductase [Corchorus olitorius]